MYAYIKKYICVMFQLFIFNNIFLIIIQHNYKCVLYLALLAMYIINDKIINSIIMYVYTKYNI